MEDDYTSRLHSVALSESESDESKKISDDKPIIEKKICCFKTNDENACILYKCLDWCCRLIRFQ